MNITFLNPPYLKNFSRPQRSPAVTKSGTLYYPMWLAYAAGLCQSEGYGVDLIDAPADDLSRRQTIDRIKKSENRLIVVETSTPSILNDTAFCEELKTEVPGLFVVLVGTHVSALPRESLLLNASVDGVAAGEFDLTILELAQALKTDTSPDTIRGLWLRRGQEIIHTGTRSPLADLDRLPFVSSIYQQFLDVKNYFNPNALFPMVTITTSRGCPHRCIFCVYPQTMMGHQLRYRSVTHVVDEMAYIKDHFPAVKAIFFEDDTFPANKKRCIAICKEIVRRKIKISWTANARVDLDLETMQIMKKAGCRCLCVGFESGNQQLLDNIRKGITLEQSKAFMAAARKTGMLIHGCFMVGLPGETMETMEETLRFAISLQPDAIQMYPVMVYPGTEAYSLYDRKHLIESKDFSSWLTPSGLHNTVIHTENLTARQLVTFCDHARKKFYLRPSYFAYKLQQIVRNPAELKRTVKSARTFFKYLVKGSDVGQLNRHQQ